ncbi:MAG: hypothetical protein ACYTF1_16690 [Planctomycetota bacterium]
MSSVPPNMVGPILQTHLTQQQLSAIRQNIRIQEDEAQRVRSAAGDEKEGTVETADEDTRIHGDAQGRGSQGGTFLQHESQIEDYGLSPHKGRHIDLKA